MDPEAQKQAIAALKPHCMKASLEPALYECWHDLPSMYLFCDQDQALPLPVQEGFARTLGSPVTYHTDASHSAFLSVPEEVIPGLELALREGRERSGIAAQ